VEGADEMEKAINERTVMALFFNAAGKSSIPHADFVAIAKRHKIPNAARCSSGCAACRKSVQIPEDRFRPGDFSGGKMIRGPQSAGLLFGRKDLITAARANHSPNEAPIGRPMKVNKEEMFGMYAALKAYIERDHKKEWEEWLQRAKHIGSQLETLPTSPPKPTLTRDRLTLSRAFMSNGTRQKLRSPRNKWSPLKEWYAIHCRQRQRRSPGFGVVLLRPDQVDIVTGRVKSILQQAI
jgi:seryl-tRNA(Sec) selenium transferase